MNDEEIAIAKSVGIEYFKFAAPPTISPEDSRLVEEFLFSHTNAEVEACLCQPVTSGSMANKILNYFCVNSKDANGKDIPPDQFNSYVKRVYTILNTIGNRTLSELKQQ